jgi:hypothetical protein
MADRVKSSPRLESGQAAVETALTLPLFLFVMLGILQMAIAYQARICTEYAAYKAARAGSVYRADCTKMEKAALMALIPSVSRTGGSTDLRGNYIKAAQLLMAKNEPPNNPAGVGTPLVMVDWQISNYGQAFDRQLEPGEQPTKLHVRLAYFYDYRIPFAGWIISRFWLATQVGQNWVGDPILPTRRNLSIAKTGNVDAALVSVAQNAIANGYYTAPIVATWSMRMMSEPLPNSGPTGRCQ